MYGGKKTRGQSEVLMYGLIAVISVVSVAFNTNALKPNIIERQ